MSVLPRMIAQLGMSCLWIVLPLSAIYFLVARLKYVARFNKLPGFHCTLGVFGVFFDMLSQFRRVRRMGMLLEQSMNGFCLIDSANRSNGGLFCLWVGTKPVVIIYAAEYIERILKRGLTKGSFYNAMEDWMGEGLITSSGHKWLSRRKMLIPAFNVKKIEASLSMLNANTDDLLKLLQDEGEAIRDLRHPVSQWAMVNICHFVLASDISIESELVKEYIQAVEGVHETFYRRALFPFLGPIFNLTGTGRLHHRELARMKKVTSALIKNRMKEFILHENSAQCDANELNNNSGRKMKHNFIDILLGRLMGENGDLAMEDVKEEVDTAIVAGFDTSSSFLTWTTYLLGLHPQVQEMLQNELDSMFERKKCDRDALTMDDLRDLPYTDAVIKESHRLHSTVGVIARLLEEDTQLGPHVIPGGTEVLIPIFSVHSNPMYWQKPARFDPERFLTPHSPHHPFAFIPFSGGGRSCIGQKFAQLEIKVGLAKIFRRFTVTSLDPLDRVRINLAVARRLIDPIRVKMTLRH